MIEFPELQQALVEAAGHRRRRASQLVPAGADRRRRVRDRPRDRDPHPRARRRGAVVVTVPDGIDEVEIGFPGRSALHAPVRDNSVLARLRPWPAGAGTIAWDDAGYTTSSRPPKGALTDAPLPV